MNVATMTTEWKSHAGDQATTAMSPDASTKPLMIRAPSTPFG
jgi:hypothetical protein